jgi:hypothetical protein
MLRELGAKESEPDCSEARHVHHFSCPKCTKRNQRTIFVAI